MAHPDWIGTPIESAWWSADSQAVFYRQKLAGSPVRATYTLGGQGGQATRIENSAWAQLDEAGQAFDAARTRAIGLAWAAGIGSATWDYRQKGLVCTVATVAQHRHTAWQRFLPEGPLAFLPLADLHQCSIVWTLPSDRADAMLALPEDAFRRALGQAFEHRLGDITTVGPRGAFPLQARHAEHYEQDGLALIGDAAHSIHPLAGQGVNLGMLDAALLADELLTQRAAGLPLHHGRALRRYSRGRRGHNAALMHGMTGFERLFAADAPALRLLRNTGMSLFDRGGLLKHWVMRVAVLGRGGL